MSNQPTSWTEDRVEKLTRMWNDGQKTRKIADELGVTRNAVIGKAHRLNLAGRPSPIKPPRAKPRPTVKSPPTPHLDDRKVAASPCQWPHGDPGQPNFHFCGAGALRGKPYCPEHYARAYLPPKVKQSPAAEMGDG